ncbi:hypothetical protein RI367_005251 [Sorochytrium milnesiophthora]
MTATDPSSTPIASTATGASKSGPAAAEMLVQGQQVQSHERSKRESSSSGSPSRASGPAANGNGGSAPHSRSTSAGDRRGDMPAAAQDTYAGGKLYIDRKYIKDAYGRTMLLRGVNLCANSKLPAHPPLADNPEHAAFFQPQSVSFVNRPFPVADAHEHFARLQYWGLSFIRLLVPWEALEHAGPGQYDMEYIAYLKELLSIMPQYGLKCFIDPHQDVWSRFSGGSGAPGWTFAVAGMDIRKFKVTGAAHVHNTHRDDYCDCTVDPETGVYIPRVRTTDHAVAPLPGDKKVSLSGTPPPMLWPTNYTKLASSTMFTLFWAGATFAPQRMVDGKNIQTFLQDCYLNCYRHLAEHVKDFEAVIGFEVMNEPHQGYIGLDNMCEYDGTATLVFGDSPSALQSFALGAGVPQEVGVWVKSWPMPTRKSTTRLLNAERESVWLPGYSCPWRDAGVWDVDEATAKDPQPHLTLLKPDYFCKHPILGRPVDFNQDFYLPFANAYAAAIHSVFPSAFVLVEPVPQEAPPIWHTHDVNRNVIFAPHWYDLQSVFNKSFTGMITHDVPSLRVSRNILAATYFGITGAKKNYTGQVKNMISLGLLRAGEKPCVIGECGIPMDINEKKAFETGDFQHHSNFLDAVISAMESNLVHFTLWNYNPGNDNVHGDFWNGEDFSIYSPRAQRQYKGSRRTAADNSLSKVTHRPTLNEVAVTNSAAATNKALHLSTKNISASIGGSLQSPTSVSSSTRFGDTPASAMTPFDINELYFDQDTPDSLHADRKDHHAGGRVLDAVIRPYACRVAGVPLVMHFDMQTLGFQLTFQNPAVLGKQTPTVTVYRDAKTQAQFPPGSQLQSLTLPLGSDLPAQCFETVIYVPSYHYELEQVHIAVSDGEWEYRPHRQTLVWRHSDQTPSALHTLVMTIRPAPSAGADGSTAATAAGAASTPVASQRNRVERGDAHTTPLSPKQHLVPVPRPTAGLQGIGVSAIALAVLSLLAAVWSIRAW